jgi:hypothetical protein
VVGGFANNNYWSSTENDNNNTWNQNFNNGNQNNNNKNNTNYVRAIRGFKQNIQYPKVKYSGIFFKSWVMQIELWELFNAYYTCRGNKRNTHNALSFEVDYENNLVQLCNDLNNKNYKIGRSIVFIVKKPVIREIFAADFRDRVVHHLIINKLNPLFEKEFISDSYACRVGKGVSSPKNSTFYK